MTVGILAEKPSAARHIADALGGMSGTYNGEDYVIASARGHLYEFVDPSKMVAPDLQRKYKMWDLANLPWDPAAMNWQLEPIKGTSDTIRAAKQALSRCDSVVCATDLDPSGEGGMIFVNAVLEMGLHPARWERMYFTDEAAASLQKAFRDRKPIASFDDFDEYCKARFRSQFDLLSMQFTRIATNMGRASGQDLVLRQGRLKSAMVLLVGDQLKAYNDYVRKPFFQNRFKDERDVVYTNPDEPRFDQKHEVPNIYGSSPVVLDKKEMKRSAPPKLLDLAALSSMLVGKGVKAALTLSTYQKMYEAQVVSYPRTEDKTITPEQFDELLPLVDRIAAVVGVDASVLTHRAPRKTHVKAKGAHGANRPGPKVPRSLDDVESTYGTAGRLIYETLARNYLATIAEDYEYERQSGHVEKYPDFVGASNVPQKPGWKAVYSTGDDEDEDAAGGLGTTAEPFVHEGANKRPEHPSMKWLMAQLEKRDVGTGATRTSTYAEVTSTKAKNPLLVEKGRKLTLAQAGEMSWRLLPGTHIGDLALTEKVYADMADIAAGRATAEERLAVVADWVREDIETMTANAATMRSDLGLQERSLAYAEGTWQAAPGGPTDVRFKKIWAGHEFTDAEIATLLAGGKISFQANKKAGGTFQATGGLGLGEFNGRTFVGFQLDERPKADKPTTWCKHAFTDAEVATLLGGGKVEADDFVGKSGKSFSCQVSWDAANKKIVPDFGSDDEPPRSWCGVKFTDKQRADLAAGKPVAGKGFLSKRTGKKFNASLTWKEEGGKKKIVASFK